jgi:hypothetical protein
MYLLNRRGIAEPVEPKRAGAVRAMLGLLESECVISMIFC